MVGIGQKQPQESKKYKLTPTKSSKFKTGVYIPKDLEDSFKELDKMLSKELKDTIRRGKESQMSEHHFGLGLWLRNNWGLWQGLRLAQWFNKQGIFHPDDMSAIILDSYWRRSNKKPLELAKQIKHYQDYWAKSATEDAKEKARVKKASEQIRQMIMGLSFRKSPVPTLKFPEARAPIRVRYAASFQAGIIVAGKEWITGRSGFVSRSYYLDLQENKLLPIQVPEMTEVLESVVVGDRLYIHGLSDERDTLLEVSKAGRRLLPAPGPKGFRLGIDRDANCLLAVTRANVSQWQGDRWEPLRTDKAPLLPETTQPAELVKGRLYLRDEGDKRLWWLDMSTLKLTSFDKHVSVVGSYGPRWEFVWSYAVSNDGEVWISTGSDMQSLVRWKPSTGYRIAVYNNGLKFVDDFFTSAEPPDGVPQHQLRPTALGFQADGSLISAGPNGVFSVRQGEVAPICWFEPRSESELNTMLVLENGQLFLGGHWGGAYILSTRTGNAHLLSLEVDRQRLKPF